MFLISALLLYVPFAGFANAESSHCGKHQAGSVQEETHSFGSSAEARQMGIAEKVKPGLKEELLVEPNQ